MSKQNRREFLKVAGLAAVGAGLAVGCHQRRPGEVPEPGPGGDTLKPDEPVLPLPRRMKLKFYPYELQLQHTFTVSSYSRTTTPGVQVEIDYQYRLRPVLSDCYWNSQVLSMRYSCPHAVLSVCCYHIQDG